LRTKQANIGSADHNIGSADQFFMLNEYDNDSKQHYWKKSKIHNYIK